MKTQLVFSFLLLGFFTGLQAQNSLKKWQIDYYYAPTYVHFWGNPIFKNFSKVNSAYSFELGLSGSRRISRQAFIYAGLSFFNARDINVSGLRWGNQHDGQGGFDPTIDSEADLVMFNNNTSFLQIPLGVRLYRPSSRAWKIYGQVGLLGEYALSTRRILAKRELDGSLINLSYYKENPTKRDWNLLLKIGAGAEYVVHSRVNLFVEPGMSVTMVRFANLLNASLASSKRLNLGLRLGFRFGF